MDTDKFIFAIISVVTVLIIIAIFFSSVKKSANVSVDVKTIVGETPHWVGAEFPKVTIVEFSDFECPFCRQFSQTVRPILGKYPNNVRLIYRHFPLPSHKGSFPAAVASEAAAKQGKFWKYHDELFLNQPDYSSQDLERYAKNSGLDLVQFKNDISNNEIIGKVQEDLEFGREIGINATPTIYLIYDEKVEKLNLRSSGDLESKIQDILGVSGNINSDETNSIRVDSVSESSLEIKKNTIE